MEPRVFRPGDELPDDQRLQVAYQITRSLTTAGTELVSHLGTGMPEAAAVSCVFSAQLSAAANIAIKYEAATSAALHFHRAAMEIRPHPAAADQVVRLTQSFIDLANVAKEKASTEAVVFALLNAVANTALAGHDRPWLVDQLRELADRMSDPEQVAAAEALGALATRPDNAIIQ